MAEQVPTVRDVEFDLPSLHVHALAAGDDHAPLVVLLHGFPEFSESWRDVLPLLAEAGYYAVAPDLRGYGATEKPGTGYDLDTLARDVSELIRGVSSANRAHVVGHDWGGAVAYHVAAHHPEQVETLTVVNSPHPAVMARRIFRPAQLRRSWYMFWFQVPVLPDLAFKRKRGALVGRIMRGALKDRSRMPHERAALYAENFAQPGVASAALAYYREAIRGSLRASRLKRLLSGYPKIPAPFRLVWGMEDVALGEELTVDLEPWFERPVVVDYLPGVGHFANVEVPERVAASILEHLRAAKP